MADNVTVDNGTLTDYDVLTDDVGGKNCQIVKLSLDADGSGAAITGSIPMRKSGSATSTLANVSGSASSVQLAAANSSRIKLAIHNDSAAVLYVKEGTTASTTDYTYKLFQDDIVIIDDYTGQVDGIWSSATGAARVTETA